MSSSRRPWFPWYPKEYNADEKVKGLSDDADLLYRRILDVLWEASDLHLPSNCLKLANQIARGWSMERFKSAWGEIQFPGFELLKTTEDGKLVYSERLIREAQKIESISKIRSESGKKAKAKQKLSKSSTKAKHRPSHPDPYPDTSRGTKVPLVETPVSTNGSCPYQKIVDLYHTTLPTLPAVRVLSEKRKKQIKARWISKYKTKTGIESNTIEFWETFFNYVGESRFLMGLEDPSPGRQRFMADLEWITNQSNFIKIFEGKYHK